MPGGMIRAMLFLLPFILAITGVALQSPAQPAPARTEVATAGFPARGPATAPVTIVEFSDFECPFCGRLFPTLKAVENLYLDRSRIVYRQFPLRRIHPLAQKAAEASLCAHEQGRFWQMHDSLFGDQEHLTVRS